MTKIYSFFTVTDTVEIDPGEIVYGDEARELGENIKKNINDGKRQVTFV